VQSTDQILQQIKKSVLASYPDATLILYGSYARGDNKKDSDIDILVLLDKEKITYADRSKIGDPLYDIQLETNILISPIIYPRNTWNTRLKVSPFHNNVTRDGIIL
jgi:uncharacterized protein